MMLGKNVLKAIYMLSELKVKHDIFRIKVRGIAL